MKLHMQSDSAVTLIENIFIDRYMPAANGEFVKLYLYLLRCATSGVDISISSIADFFDHTEKDVKRALSYWEKLDLLRLQYDSADNITDIVFLSGNHTSQAISGSSPVPDITDAELTASDAGSCADAEPDSAIPDKRSMTPARRKELSAQEEIRQIIFIGSQYLSRPLTTTEINTILYFYDCLHFSQDLIIYLLEYCADKGNPGVRYMERVAQEWYKDGITTVEAAKQTSHTYNRDYYAVFKAMGLGDRKITPAEKEYIDRWLGTYQFDMPIIEEACARTILQTHEPSFPYTESILAGWYRSHVKNKNDIAKLDQEYASRQTSSRMPARTSSSKTHTVKANSKTARSTGDNRFTRIPQRDYNWDKLEMELLQSQSSTAE